MGEMKTTKDQLYEYLIKHTGSLANCPQGVSTEELAKALGRQRTNISTLLNQMVNEGIVVKTTKRPVRYCLKSGKLPSDEDSCFKEMIGYNGSLRNVTQSAKAAILYPHTSLSMIIIGPNGCGKTYFAKMIYQFAKECHVLSNENFQSINCANYETSEDLQQALFGKPHDNFKNVIDLSNNGVLFIDNGQLINGFLRDKLLRFIANGDYTYPGQEEVNYRELSLIMSMDSNDTNAIDAYRGKIAFRFELPDLAQRPLSERLEFIQRFLTIEATRCGKTLEINAEVLRALLLYDCPGNVRQLNMDIKLACANAYVRNYDQNENKVKINLTDFQPEVRKGFLNYKEHASQVEEIIPSDYDYQYAKDRNPQRTYSNFNNDRSLYESIETASKELKGRGLDDSDINAIIATKIKSMFNEYQKSLEAKAVNVEQLSKLVDIKVIEMVERFIKNTEAKLQYVYPQSVVYGLSLHINSILNQSTRPTHLSKSRIEEIVENHAQEFSLAQKFALDLEKEYNLHLSVDEVVLITMFILKESANNLAHPSVLIAMHGEAVASDLVTTVKALVKTDNVYAFDMSLDSETHVAYEELKELILKIDKGAGVIAIYDMGSLKQMLATIALETKVELRMICAPVTLIAIDAARKCSYENDIDFAYHELRNSLDTFLTSHTNKNKAIVTFCTTGEGGAVQIKNYIDKYSKLNYKVFAVAGNDRKVLTTQIKQILADNDIDLIVGTSDPKLFGIPFVSIERIFQVAPAKLDRILQFDSISEVNFDWDPVYRYLQESLKKLDIPKAKELIQELISNLEDQGIQLNTNQEVGLTLHLSCMIDSLLSNMRTPPNPYGEKIIKENKELYNIVRPSIRKTEKAFNIIIPDDEIANIITIIGKLQPEGQ